MWNDFIHPAGTCLHLMTTLATGSHQRRNLQRATFCGVTAPAPAKCDRDRKGNRHGTCGASSVPKRNHEWHQPRPSARVDYYLAVTQERLSPGPASGNAGKQVTFLHAHLPVAGPATSGWEEALCPFPSRDKKGAARRLNTSNWGSKRAR